MNDAKQTVRLGQDPVVRESSNGTKIVSFRGAVKKSYAREGEDPTAWFNYTAYGKTAEHIAKYLKKGSFCLISSEPIPRSYTDKNYSDVTHYVVDFIVQKVEFLDGKKDSEGGSAQTASAPAPAPVSAPAPVEDDGFDPNSFDF